MAEIHRGGVERSDDRARPHHRHALGDRLYLPQLVADKDDRLPLCTQAAEDDEEVLDLVWRKDARRLVEDQQVGVAVEEAQDLEPLTLCDRERPHRPVPGEAHAQLRGETLRPRDRSRTVEQQTAMRLDAENEVLERRQALEQLEALLHHADAAGERVRRARQADR